MIKFDYVTVVRATEKTRGEICGFLLWIVCLWADSIFGVKIRGKSSSDSASFAELKIRY